MTKQDFIKQLTELAERGATYNATGDVCQMMDTLTKTYKPVEMAAFLVSVYKVLNADEERLLKRSIQASRGELSVRCQDAYVYTRDAYNVMSYLW